MRAKAEEDSNVDVVWYDYGLIPGEEFEPRLMEEIRKAKVIIVLWCSLAVKSEWVNKEARAAKDARKYLPCWIEAAKLPEEFAKLDVVNLTNWDGSPRSHVLDRLLEHVGRMTGREVAGRHTKLTTLDQRWRNYGAPSMAQFAPSPSLEHTWRSTKRRSPVPLAPPQRAPTLPNKREYLGPPPGGLSPHWRRIGLTRGEVKRSV